MNSQKIKEIIKFSFTQNIKSKWFIIFNIISLLSIVLIINWGSVVEFFEIDTSEEIVELYVIDNNNLAYENFEKDFEDVTKYNVTKIESNTFDKDNIEDNIIIEIVKDEVQAFKVSIISAEGIEGEFYDSICASLVKIRNNILAQRYELTENELELLQSDIEVERVMLSVDTENSDIKELIKLFSTVITYMISILIFSKLANEIVSEKQSKSIEYILTTVSAKEYLFAKIFSSISILLIQGILLLVYYFIGALVANLLNYTAVQSSLMSNFDYYSASKEIVLYILFLIVYNILNLILLCILQAAASSKTSSTAEAGNSVSTVLFIMMFAYFLTLFFVTPYEKMNMWVYVLSCLPIFSAYFVPAMMIIGQSTAWQIIVSLAVLILSIPVTFNYCSKVFKNGVLDYTKVKKAKKKEEVSNEKVLIIRDMKNFGFVIGLAIILYVGVQTIFSLINGIVLPTFLGEILDDSSITLVMQILLQILSLGISTSWVSMYINKKNEIKKNKEVKFRQKTKIVFMSITIIFILQFLLSIVLYPFIGLDYDTTDLFDVDSNSALMSKIILFVAIAVIPAIFEEIFFRKAIIDFSIKYGRKFALIFSALLFGLIHMNLSQGLFAFIIGLIFGVIYIYTGDIKLTILIHFINNGIAALLLILPEFGGVIITIALICVMIIGFIHLIKTLANKESRTRLFGFWCGKLNLKAFSEKYVYIFTDYVFDISIILVILMSLMTERILR